MSTDRSEVDRGGWPALARPLWWAYERAPTGFDRLFHLGRRYVAPLLRHRLSMTRMTGRCPWSGRAVTVVTAGSAMTLDFLVARAFAGSPEVERLGSVSLAGLARVMDDLAATADLGLACVPRALAHWFGDRYLRVPALVSFRLGIGVDLEATLAAAAYNVRRDARRAVESGYSWTFTRELGDFERFYHELYRPFIRSRFGPLAVLREPAELRRHFRHDGGVIWVRQAERVVAGGLVRVRGRELRALVEAVHPDWRQEVKPSPQFAVNIATFDVARRLGCSSVDLGGTAPSLRDGVFRAKRAWGAKVQISGESHRQLLVRWPAPGTALLPLLHAAPLLFEAWDGLCALATTERGGVADLATGQELWRQLAPAGLRRLYVLGADNPVRAAAATERVPDASIRLVTGVDAAQLNRAAYNEQVPAPSRS